MSIRSKLFGVCFCLITITVGMGVYSLVVQQRLGAVATGIYDEAFLAVSYLRAAQNSLLKAGMALHRGAPAEAAALLANVAEDLVVADERAMSPDGHTAILALQSDLGPLRARLEHRPPDSLGRSGQDARINNALARLEPQGGPDDTNAALAALDRMEARFDDLVEVFAADGYRYRTRAGNLASESVTRTGLLIAGCAVVAALVAALGGFAIVPAIRRAVDVADAIAAGRLDTPIDARGSDETAQLLRSLATMQASIAHNLADMAASREAIAHQHARFDAALNNMTQGLCLLDAAGSVLVTNARLHEMFISPDAAMALPGADPRADPARDGAPGACDLPDGRAVAVARTAVDGGGWVVTFEDVSARRAAEARLAHMARHDALTGLPNRLMFREHLTRGLDSPGATGLALLCLDLDRFKSVNDTLGHPAGDLLLQAVSRRLLAAIAPTDLVVRLGGDEFAVVQMGAIQPGDAQTLAQSLIAATNEPFDIEGQQVSIGGSIGISLAIDGDMTADALLKRADLALYQAKADGRGRARLFETGMDVQVAERRALEHDLRRAVDHEAFELHYHPFVSIATGRIEGFEALLRWPDTTRGMVPPNVFIPVAEEIGLIERLGAWALRRACRDAASWPTPVSVAVNLSARQFGPDLVLSVSQALVAAGLPASRLELEITESLLIDDRDSALQVLHAIKQLGVRIAMDDFGTGYSSLSYFHRFPFDKVKIDQSFIRNLDHTPDSIAIIRAVVGLGATLGITVVAEGVETQAQLDQLRREGCEEAQGFLFTRPIPANQVPGFLDAPARPLRIAHFAVS